MTDKVIQFKRILHSTESLDKTIELLQTNLKSALQDGEPLVCSYGELVDGEPKTRFLLAIGTPQGVHIMPAFRNTLEIDSFISSRSSQGKLIDQISEESDFIITMGTDGKSKFTIKDDLKNI